MYNIPQAVNKMAFRERSNGLLEGRVSYMGERKSFYGESKAECKRKAREYLEKREKGTYNPNKITLNEYMEEWLNTYKRTTVEPSSYARLVSVFEHQIKETIGKKRLSEITADDIQRLINDHALGIGGRKPLAKSGLKRIMHLLGPCFAHAVKKEVIAKNPCEDVVIPRESNILTKTKEQFALSDEEIMRFREAAMVRTKKGQIRYRDALVLVFMIGTGLRIGEMIALKWDDIYFEENYIHIHSTLQTGLLGEEKTRIKDGTKTAAERMMPLNSNLKDYLYMMKEYDEEKGITSDYVACTRVGTQQDPSNLSRSLERLLKRAKLSDAVTPHTLRHTFGSALIRAGVGIEIVSRLMGHANIMITYTKYIHVIKEQEAKAMTMTEII